MCAKPTPLFYLRIGVHLTDRAGCESGPPRMRQDWKGRTFRAHTTANMPSLSYCPEYSHPSSLDTRKFGSMLSGRDGYMLTLFVSGSMLNDACTPNTLAEIHSDAEDESYDLLQRAGLAITTTRAEIVPVRHPLFLQARGKSHSTVRRESHPMWMTSL